MPDCPDIIEIETLPVPDEIEVQGNAPFEIEVGIPGPPGESEVTQYDTDLALIYQTAKL